MRFGHRLCCLLRELRLIISFRSRCFLLHVNAVRIGFFFLRSQGAFQAYRERSDTKKEQVPGQRCLDMFRGVKPK